MRAVALVRAASSGPGRFWARASRRPWISTVVLTLAACCGGWATYAWLFSWPARLALRSEGFNYPVAYSPDGSKLATATGDGFILWDIRDGRKLANWSCPAKLKGASGKFSPDGKTFEAFWDIQNQKNPQITLLDVATGRTLWSSARPKQTIWGSAFLDDGRTLRVFSGDKTGKSIVDIDRATGKVGPPLPLSCPTTISFQSLSDNGRTLAIVETRNLTIPVGTRSVIFWDVDRDRQIGVVSASVPVGSINALCLSRDGKTLVMSLSDQTIEVWDVPSVKLVKKFPIHSSDFRPRMLRISADGSRVASIGFWASRAPSVNSARFFMQRLSGNPDPLIFELVVHDVSTGRRLGRADREGMATVLSDDGRSLATLNEDSATRVRDLPPSR